MAFQPKGSFPKVNGTPQTAFPESPAKSFDSQSFDSMINQIAEAVREKLIQQGVPTSGAAHVNAGSNPSGATWARLIQEGADRIGHSAESSSPFQPHLSTGDGELAAKIDHTLLKSDATREEILKVCEEARKYHFATVCVNSTYIGIAAEALKGSSTKAIAVVGFPLGAAATATKAFEAREAVHAGAQEIDMVINIGALNSRDYSLVLEDIRQVVESSKPFPVKVILETSSLNDDQKIIGCALAKAAGAAFVKTSTGFASGGATAEDVALMRRIVGPEMGVKASGGIRTYEDATRMIAAGATRIGASASVAIVTQRNTGPAGKKNGFHSGEEAMPKKPFKNSLY